MVVVIILLLVLLVASVYLNIRFGTMLLRIEDNMQKALDYLDERYASINQLLHDTHLVANDEIANAFVEEIKRALNGILYAASVLRDPSADIEKMLEQAKEDVIEMEEVEDR